MSGPLLWEELAQRDDLRGLVWQAAVDQQIWSAIIWARTRGAAPASITPDSSSSSRVSYRRART